MIFYNWREMVAWVAIFIVALAIIIVGIENSGNAGTLRVAVGSEQSAQGRIGDAVKQLIERRTSLKVVLVKGEDSASLQRLLLDGKVDVAVLAPAALSEGLQSVGVAPLGSLFANVLLDPKQNENSLFDLKGIDIKVGPQTSDSYALGLSILQDLELSQKNELSMKDDPRASVGVANIITDHFVSPVWSSLLDSGRFRVIGVREAAAVVARNPLWVAARIPAYVYSSPRGQLPSADLQTVATPLVLATLPEASPSLIAELVSAVNGSEGLALRARYDAAATDAAWQVLAKHAAAGGDALPIKDLLRNELAWWVEHKTLVLLIVAGLMLVIYQMRHLRASRTIAQTRIVTAEIQSMMNQLLSIESRIRGENDLRVLYQFMEDIEQMKVRGSKLMLNSALAHDTLLFTFHQQCNHVTSVIEKRLHGKPVLASVA